MTDKRRKAIRELASQLGINRRAAASRLDHGRQAYPTGAIEVLAFDPAGQHYLGIVTFVPPGLRNGTSDPTEGIVMGPPLLRNAGRYILVEPTGRARHVLTERGAGGGSFMAVPTEPDTFVAVQVIYSLDPSIARGVATEHVLYRVVPDRRPVPGGNGFNIRPLTQGATVNGRHVFGALEWRQVFDLIEAAHPGRTRHTSVLPAKERTTSLTSVTQRLPDMKDIDATFRAALERDLERQKPGPHHEEDCPLSEGTEGHCECIGPFEDYSSEGDESHGSSWAG